MYKAFSYAKINLFLHILSKRDDGYHNINSLFTRVSLCDYISVEKADAFIIKSNIKSLEDKNNLIYKVYAKLKKIYSIPPIEVNLYKNIPLGSGLGGGSSNAAVFLNILDLWFDLGLTINDKKEILSDISSDAIYFLYKGSRIISGKGENVSRNILLPKFNILLIKPPFDISTRDIYNSGLIQYSNNKEFKINYYLDLIGLMYNDLERPIFDRYPLLKNLKDMLINCGADNALVTGSGSCVYGIFSSKYYLNRGYRLMKNKFRECNFYRLINI
ncbi:MAG: 4-(cytidine 5'-diphospho)-2-C-methyl-D-erythritol kinase [Deferribacterota bacterium]|nr:4-(cytidine 5'-diphospho)-2-C-methyl-D-erythritol kinase [Deferribacterota bacterium]